MNQPLKFSNTYHPSTLQDASVLITGGAGFIGSNIVAYLLQNGVKKVRVLDNMSNGHMRNIEPFIGRDQFEFMQGDITNTEDCERACKGITHMSHQAALGSVPRSIKNPVATSDTNTTGFLNIMLAAKNAGIQRIVYASSSSVYGDSQASPKKEHQLGNPLSPYAVSKLTNELYASVFHINYGMDLIGLRYFNVFGPNQDPGGPYAAAIPLFMHALLEEREAIIFGDGEQTRDFTFVENAVQANILALFTENQKALNQVYNVAVGENTSINNLYQTIAGIIGNNSKPVHHPERVGDIRNSLADIGKARELLGYDPQYSMEKGLGITIEWFKKTFSNA